MPDNKTIEDKLAAAVVGETDRDNPNVRVYGYLTRTNDAGPPRYRLHASPEDRSTFLEFDASAVDDVGANAPDGRVEVRFKPAANLRQVVAEQVTPARFLRGALTSHLSATTEPALVGAVVRTAPAWQAATSPTDCGPARTHCSTCYPGCGGPFDTRDGACGVWDRALAPSQPTACGPFATRCSTCHPGCGISFPTNSCAISFCVCAF